MSRDAFIKAMRGVAHSVCVVTTAGEDGKSGATVSAFCSVSADPPTALVCLNTDSHITDQVIKNGMFNINILPEGAAHIANRFAGMHDNEVADRFDGIELIESDIPVLKGTTYFRCKVQETVKAGSHHVFIGLVEYSEALTSSPLAYLEGAYHKVTALEDQS